MCEGETIGSRLSVIQYYISVIGILGIINRLISYSVKVHSTKRYLNVWSQREIITCYAPADCTITRTNKFNIFVDNDGLRKMSEHY